MNLEETLQQIVKKMQSEIPLTRYIATRHLTGIIIQHPQLIQQIHQEKPHLITKIMEILAEEKGKNQILEDEASRAREELQKIIPVEVQKTSNIQPRTLQTCPKCGTRNRNNWKYCPECGARLIKKQGTVTCLICRQEIEPLQICSNCGSHI
jgi:DNA-directed RNA polymerase subunit M/transcription elongation factor TFIIS